MIQSDTSESMNKQTCDLLGGFRQVERALMALTYFFHTLLPESRKVALRAWAGSTFDQENRLWHAHTTSWRRQWHPTPVLLPGKSHGRRSLVGCSPWGRYELDTAERLRFHFSLSCIGEENGNPLQCSCLENPRDEGAWCTAICGVAQSRTRLQQLSSSSACRRRRHWQPTPVLLPGKSHGRRSLVGCSPWGLTESDTTDRLHFHFSLSCIGEGNGNPLQCFLPGESQGQGSLVGCRLWGCTESDMTEAT